MIDPDATLPVTATGPSAASGPTPSSTVSAPGLLPPGQRIGRYLLQRRLGQGGMAEVFLARQEGPSDFQKTVVVKRMLGHLVENKKFVEMFLREARVAARLNHPNVVQLFELGQDQGTYFLAMEFIDGITLHRLAKRAWARGKALPTEVIVRAMGDAALGLHHAHTLLDEGGQPAGLVHRDISPDNLMMTRDGVTKVLDFGIAKGQEQKSGVTKTGELKGKIPYMSPEQIQGFTLDGRTDLFSLGVTFYWLLCGKRPFDAANEVMTLKSILDDNALPPSAVNKTVPPVLDRIVMRLLSKDLAGRYSTGLQVHDRLQRLLGENASRSAAIELVNEMIAAGDPGEDDDGETLRVPRGDKPASMPISESFAPTTVTRAGALSTRRGAFAGVTAAAVVGALGAISLLVLARDKAAEPAAPSAPVSALVSAPSPTTTTSPAGAPSAPPSAAPSTALSASAPDVAPSALHKRPAAAESITLKGPASIAWRVVDGTKKGPGVAKVKPGARTVTAVDTRRGSTHVVPIVNDVADFDALPTGTLIVRAVPYAQVFVGSENLGSTMPPKPVALPVGTYNVKLVFEGKTKIEAATIARGAPTELRVNMRDP